MTAKELFTSTMIMFKAKLSEDDFNKLIEIGMDYTISIARANLLARIINSGINVRFWWQEVEGKGFRILWETDNRLNGQHIDCNPGGHTTAEDAMKAIIDTIRELAKMEEEIKRKIIVPN
jgi:hypothetical protein